MTRKKAIYCNFCGVLTPLRLEEIIVHNNGNDLHLYPSPEFDLCEKCVCETFVGQSSPPAIERKMESVESEEIKESNRAELVFCEEEAWKFLPSSPFVAIRNPLNQK